VSFRDALEQVPIKPLIEHSKEANARMGDTRLIGGILLRFACGSKVPPVDAAGKEMCV
jgi:hypothetical protein